MPDTKHIVSLTDCPQLSPSPSPIPSRSRSLLSQPQPQPLSLCQNQSLIESLSKPSHQSNIHAELDSMPAGYSLLVGAVGTTGECRRGGTAFRWQRDQREELYKVKMCSIYSEDTLQTQWTGLGVSEMRCDRVRCGKGILDQIYIIKLKKSE